MPFAPINGIDLYYEVHGSGPAVLFAHGQGGNHLSWWQQVPFFAQHYTCITFDHRAFGQSVDRDNRGRRAFGEDAMALLDHLGIEDVRVVAHSMGGRTAVALAVRDPKQRCRAIVLAGNSGGLGDDMVQERRAEAAAARGDRGLGAFSVAEPFRHEHPEMYFLLRQISRMNPSRPRDFLTAPVLRPASPPPTGSNHDRLAATGVPVFYVVGEHDAICPPDMIEMCHKLVERSRYHMVRGSGHSAYFEKPDEFNAVVLDFLRSTEMPGEREEHARGVVDPATAS
jgi:pimeloyl-ACP methyl ester carboxylesterase